MSLMICRLFESKFWPKSRNSSSSSSSSRRASPSCNSSVTVAVGMGISKGATVKSVWNDWIDSGGFAFGSDGVMEAKGKEPQVAVSACTVNCFKYASTAAASKAEAGFEAVI